tara:strand:- start:568 stop:696 length:129 start_codon:yes stop_codon:yes gene_type:complete
LSRCSHIGSGLLIVAIETYLFAAEIILAIFVQSKTGLLYYIA